MSGEFFQCHFFKKCSLRYATATCAWQLVSKDKAQAYVVFVRVNAGIPILLEGEDYQALTFDIVSVGC